MDKCKKDLSLMEQQRQFIDPYLRELENNILKNIRF